MLGEAHYVRYDETTCTRLMALAQKLNTEHAGRVSSIKSASVDRQDFESRLLAFNGVGPKTVEIFMREASRVIYTGGAEKFAPEGVDPENPQDEQCFAPSRVICEPSFLGHFVFAFAHSNAEKTHKRKQCSKC